MDYSEATAIRRSTRLVLDSQRLDFSVLNAIVWIVLLMLVGAGILSIFGAV